MNAKAISRKTSPSSNPVALAAGPSRRLMLHGLRRVRRGKGFSYVTAAGEAIRAAEIARLIDLKIPPAWTEVRICPQSGGRLQAIGYDARGRLQYLYHVRFRAKQDATKYARLHEFARVLPKIRRRVQRDLRKKDLSRTTVLAAAVRLLDRTHVRIGNDEYAQSNDSYGLTTLRNRHATVAGKTICFNLSLIHI